MRYTNRARTRLIEIEMCVKEGVNYSPDWANDFFDAGTLDYDEKLDAAVLPDMDEAIHNAKAWGEIDSEADKEYYDEFGSYPDEDRCVWIRELEIEG